jgi:L-fucono-1,5-lactonase
VTVTSATRLGIVDAHQHVWDLSAHRQPWLELPGHESLLRDYSEADLQPLAAAASVTATVVVQTVTEPTETADLLALASASELVAAVVGWTDLEAAGVADALSAMKEGTHGSALRGIRHPVLTEPDRDWLRRPAVLAGLTAVGGAGLTYDLVLPADLLPAAAEAAVACPGTLFVLDHLGNPPLASAEGSGGSSPRAGRADELWTTELRRLAALPNTVAKLSGILAEPPPPGRTGVAHLVPYYETALAAFGPDRLMFGSDWPVCTLSAPYDRVVAAATMLTAGLSQLEQDQVFAGTARRVYRLG